ncbi:hypothetical protein BC938DRAFT_481842 [Jimgerdemannia flammicorona]|uniref:Uncharacterized protein n=1 Tax=Jimgerdemannia flammicorona TaxID=994334 RepID=A0A433QFA4_9FUNG|nr:hypothetical protein BC938DRAFT_481842 [Jimgerdemannia flammicorona]
MVEPVARTTGSDNTLELVYFDPDELIDAIIADRGWNAKKRYGSCDQHNDRWGSELISSIASTDRRFISFNVNGIYCKQSTQNKSRPTYPQICMHSRPSSIARPVTQRKSNPSSCNSLIPIAFISSSFIVP